MTFNEQKSRYKSLKFIFFDKINSSKNPFSSDFLATTIFRGAILLFFGVFLKTPHASMFYLRNRNKTQKQTKGFYK